MATLVRRRVLELPAEPLPLPAPRRRRPVLRFWARALAFWSPVLALVAGFELLLWRARESWSLERAMAFQSAHPEALWLRGMLDQAMYGYKRHNFVQRRPGVVAVGTSRVLEFRAGMFGADSADFYNLGGLVASVGDLQTFVRGLPASGAPRLVVVGVDIWWLNPNHVAYEALSKAGDYDAAHDWRQHVAAGRRLIRRPDLRRKVLRALQPPPTQATRFIGVEAQSCRCGFRPDGSMDYGATLRPPGAPFVDVLAVPVVENIRQGIGNFEFAPGVSAARLDSLVALLRELRGKGTTVLVMLPPVWSGAASALERQPRLAGLWRDYRTRVPAVLRGEGFPVLDASTPAALGLTDDQMIDGWHGDETFYAVAAARLLDLSRAPLAAAAHTAAERRADGEGPPG